LNEDEEDDEEPCKWPHFVIIFVFVGLMTSGIPAQTISAREPRLLPCRRGDRSRGVFGTRQFVTWDKRSTINYKPSTPHQFTALRHFPK